MDVSIVIKVGYCIRRGGGNSEYWLTFSYIQMHYGAGYPWTTREGLAYHGDLGRTDGIT